jgi:RHS repeat-associated protein
VLEYDGATGAVQAWYAYGLGSNTVLNAMDVTSGTRQTLIPDIQGSIIASLDSTGTLTRAAYHPYGESPVTTGSFRYAAMRIDPETNGLYYDRARTYSPIWGRFLQPDPIGYAGGINLYGYANNDPLNLTDQIGLIVLSLGGSGEAYFIFGGGGGAGIYYDTDTGRIGTYVAGEAGVGIGLSAGINFGVSKSMQTFQGFSSQIRVGAGPVTGQANMSHLDKPITGGSVSSGVGVPFDFTISKSYTSPTCWISCGNRNGQMPQAAPIEQQQTTITQQLAPVEQKPK